MMAQTHQQCSQHLKEKEMKFLPLILIAGLTGLSLPSTAAASPEKGLEIAKELDKRDTGFKDSCLLYTSPSPRDGLLSRMPSSA